MAEQYWTERQAAADQTGGKADGQVDGHGTVDGPVDWESAWDPPRPELLPDLRTRLAEQTRSPVELDQTAQVLAGGRGAIVPHTKTPEEAARILLQQEEERLAGAQLYYATPEMTRLAVTAGESLPDFHCEPEDVPDRYGFIVFGEPIGSYVNTDVGERVRVPIVAASWGPWNPGHWPNGGVWLTYYSPTDFDHMAHLTERMEGRPPTPAEMTRMRSMRGPLVWDNECALCYGGDLPASYKPGASFDATQNTTAPWIQSVRAAWLLMSQPNIAEVEERPQPRPVRRRAERAGHGTGPIRLLHLRRTTRDHAASGDGETASREYTCRWMVRGHWRQQWYPSREVHRPVWINPHIKGPEDQPLKTGETVHIWDRGPTE